MLTRMQWLNFGDVENANQSQLAEQAVQQIAQIYAIEREVKDLDHDQAHCAAGKEQLPRRV